MKVTKCLAFTFSCSASFFISSAGAQALNPMKNRLVSAVTANDEKVSPRLRMTFNLVMRARSKNSAETCSEVAKRWLNLNRGKAQEGLTPKEIAHQLLASGNLFSLERRDPAYLLRLESNLQNVRWPAFVRADFGGRAESLLKVFKFVASENNFQESTMENQIDRKRMLNEPNVLAHFKSWLALPENIWHLDRGTLIIPARHLAKRAFSTAPCRITRAANRPFLGLFTSQEIEQILNTKDSSTFDFIKSTQDFQRRLDEVSCTGFHPNAHGYGVSLYGS